MSSRFNPVVANSRIHVFNGWINPTVNIHSWPLSNTHRFELWRSIYTWVFFFPNKYILHYPGLVESENVELQIERANCKVIHRFLIAQRTGVHNPHPVQGSTFFYPFIHQQVDSILWLLWIMLQWTWGNGVTYREYYFHSLWTYTWK